MPWLRGPIRANKESHIELVMARLERTVARPSLDRDTTNTLGGGAVGATCDAGVPEGVGTAYRAVIGVLVLTDTDQPRSDIRRPGHD